MRDLFDILSGDSWFSALPKPQREGLIARGRRHLVADGTHVYRIGDPPNGLHAVVGGQLRLVSYPGVGQELVNMIVKPGRWFGELSVIDGKERPHDAIASGPSEILSVPIKAIQTLASAMPDLWRGLALLNCVHHRLGMREAAQVRAMPAIARLARFLAGGKSDVPLQMTQDELARVVGVSRQRVNGLLQQLAQRRLVEVGYGWIERVNRDGLLTLAESTDGD